MRIHSAIFPLVASIWFLASAAPAVATDPCWYEVSYNAVLGTWQIGSSSTAAGCASLISLVPTRCANIYSQTAQRNGEIHCCWIDQSTTPPYTSGFEPGWCRWPNG